MDEAFQPLHGMIENLLSFNSEFTDTDAGVRSYITACEIEAPIELDVSRDASNELRIGTTPPIYYVQTSILPSFHQIRFRAELTEPTHG